MAILDNVKEVARLAQEVGKLDLYKQAVDLMAQVTELAQENFALQEQVRELRDQLQRERDAAQIKGKLKNKNGLAYNLVRDDGTEDGPFCFRCFDVDRMLVRVQRLS